MARSAVAAARPLPAPTDVYTVQFLGSPLRAFNLPTFAAEARLIPDPPEGTGYVYGMLDGVWTPVVPLAGAQMEGSLYLARDPLIAREGATKQYVDDREILVDGGFY